MQVGKCLKVRSLESLGAYLLKVCLSERVGASDVQPLRFICRFAALWLEQKCSEDELSSRDQTSTQTGQCGFSGHISGILT